MKNSTYFLLDIVLVFCLATLLQTVYGQQPCTTQSFRPGVCVLAKACPPIVKILMSSMRTREETQLLQHSIRSCTQTGSTKACCEKPTMDLPPYLRVCKRNDPYFDTCIENCIIEMGKRLEKGDSEFGIKELEPIFVENFLDGLFLPGNLILYLQNATFTGLSKQRISNARFSESEKKITYDANHDHLFINSSISVDLPGNRFSVFPFFRGNIFGDYSANSKFTLIYKLIRRGGTEYMEFTSVDIKLNLRQNSIRFYTSGGDSYLGNDDQYLGALAPQIEKSFENTYFDAANEFVSQYTYNQLFPEF
ncbi:uncharacterized protein LOC143913919 [Arctopsyche grandis]|uniref:uncharacterized protein LOC143913919 n=1 Tax=Arctopsyche grandis TaxID=121162 RepID=UPI00406D8AC7